MVVAAASPPPFLFHLPRGTCTGRGGQRVRCCSWCRIDRVRVRGRSFQGLSPLLGDGTSARVRDALSYSSPRKVRLLRGGRALDAYSSSAAMGAWEAGKAPTVNEAPAFGPPVAGFRKRQRRQVRRSPVEVAHHRLCSRVINNGRGTVMFVPFVVNVAFSNGSRPEAGPLDRTPFYI
jgi:hypothetical protein